MTQNIFVNMSTGNCLKDAKKCLIELQMKLAQMLLMMASSCQIACHQALLSNLGPRGSMGRFMQWYTQCFMMFNNIEIELCIIST